MAGWLAGWVREATGVGPARLQVREPHWVPLAKSVVERVQRVPGVEVSTTMM